MPSQQFGFPSEFRHDPMFFPQTIDSLSSQSQIHFPATGLTRHRGHSGQSPWTWTLTPQCLSTPLGGKTPVASPIEGLLPPNLKLVLLCVLHRQFLVFFFEDRVSVSSPGWPLTRYLPGSVSRALGLQACEHPLPDLLRAPQVLSYALSYHWTSSFRFSPPTGNSPLPSLACVLPIPYLLAVSKAHNSDCPHHNLGWSLLVLLIGRCLATALLTPSQQGSQRPVWLLPLLHSGAWRLPDPLTPLTTTLLTLPSWD